MGIGWFAVRSRVGGVCSPTVHSVSADGRRQWLKTDTSHVLVVRTLRDGLPIASIHVSHPMRLGASLYPRFRVFYQPPANSDVGMGAGLEVICRTVANSNPVRLLT